MKLLIEFAVFALVIAVLYRYFRVRHNLRKPKKMPFGLIVNKVCVVEIDEIQAWFRKLEEMEESKTHLVRERRMMKFGILGGILRKIVLNTTLFQAAVLFEKVRIDPAKRSIDHEPWERLVFILIDESTELRLNLFQAQRELLIKTITRKPFDKAVVQELLDRYKQLEEDIIHLAAMGETTTYRELLIERLGLSRFYVIEDGRNDDYGPEPA